MLTLFEIQLEVVTKLWVYKSGAVHPNTRAEYVFMYTIYMLCLCTSKLVYRHIDKVSLIRPYSVLRRVYNMSACFRMDILMNYSYERVNMLTHILFVGYMMNFVVLLLGYIAICSLKAASMPIIILWQRKN